MIAGISNCLTRDYPNQKGETEEGEFHSPEQNTWAILETSLIMIPKNPPPPSPPPMSCRSCLEWGDFSHHSMYHAWCWSERLPKRPSLRNTLKPTTRKSPRLMCTLMALLRMQFRMEGQESTFSTQEAKKTKLASLLAYTPQIIKLKQKPWKQQQPILKSALLLLPMMSSLRMPCPSCRPSSQIGTLNTTTCLLLLPHFVEAMQSPCNGSHPTARCLAMRLLTLAKEGTTKEQVDRSTSYPEVKTILKAKQHSKWRHQHPRHNKADPYFLLTRREQVTVFRLWTGHNCLNYHLQSKLRIGHAEQCLCGTGSQTTENLLQSCPIYKPLRKGIWPDPTPVARKLYDSLGEPAMHCHLHRGDWSIHLGNETKRRRRRSSQRRQLNDLVKRPDTMATYSANGIEARTERRWRLVPVWWCLWHWHCHRTQGTALETRIQVKVLGCSCFRWRLWTENLVLNSTSSVRRSPRQREIRGSNTTWPGRLIPLVRNLVAGVCGYTARWLES